MRVQLRNGYTQAYVQIMQHTHTHKAMAGRVEAKKLFLVEGNQTIQTKYSIYKQNHIIQQHLEDLFVHRNMAPFV